MSRPGPAARFRIGVAIMGIFLMTGLTDDVEPAHYSLAAIAALALVIFTGVILAHTMPFGDERSEQ